MFCAEYRCSFVLREGDAWLTFAEWPKGQIMVGLCKGRKGLSCAADAFAEQMTWKALAPLSLVVDLAHKYMA